MCESPMNVLKVKKRSGIKVDDLQQKSDEDKQVWPMSRNLSLVTTKPDKGFMNKCIKQQLNAYQLLLCVFDDECLSSGA